ncbi:uncharacterized protein (DUF1810 family) [Pedobacter cryoconitis]|uniref:Uncharacterized protein (DUF1810 family) n=1 Tax=Pedobacter cryoconitis TaxID=188932 RepID=A0A7W9DM38_9SPHI|nr:DUF1810 domain-containing protein [Pedobacter cryoconitis]MBB5623529.1 uncharacterized protein (DUF1810 family) [Pedobacter cryoconitis]MBB5645358.1 uncharacterized protein (DUF1810 family) [Pedobacter cryoconitis]
MKSHDLERFITAQKGVFQTALGEIQQGKKNTHWMWYIFPQIQGLGFTENSKYYGIKDLQEAAEFLHHRVLGPRLILMCHTLLALETNDAHLVLSSPDDLKLKSCMTLFSEIPNSDPVFEKVLKKFFNGLKDHITLKILNLHR